MGGACFSNMCHCREFKMDNLIYLEMKHEQRSKLQ